MTRKISIAVIGNGFAESGSEEYETAERIGELLIDSGHRLLTGGLGGVMEAASKGARTSSSYMEGDILGILPGLDPEDANEFVDVAIPTGLGIGRNMIVTNADAVIAVGGGTGTLSEMAFAWQKGKLLIALILPGWSGELAGRRMDERTRHPDIPDDRVREAETPEEAVRILNSMLPLYMKGGK